MAYPPNKRHKGSNMEAAAFNDPFGDDDDFTQENWNEIDIIASQALDERPPQTSTKTNGSVSGPGELNKLTLGSRHTPGWISKNREQPTGYSSRTENPQPPHGFGNGLQSKANTDLCYSTLETQHTNLKRKLKEVEEEMLMKNGEIHVLRDSLRSAQQEKEQQRQAQLLLERERNHAQSEREKELSKKVQSLQSELDFKAAEMHEIKTKLQISERGLKAVASPVSKNSPRMLSSATPLHCGSGRSSASPVGSAFITKETFGAQLRSPAAEGSDGRKPSSGRHGGGDEASHSGTSTQSGLSYHHHPGSVLLGLLLQHPLDPSPLGLCHLLCLSPEALPSLTLLGYPAGCSSSLREPRVLQRGETHSGFSQLQSLAMSGLDMMAVPEQVSHIDLFSRTCPGAVHLLPLLEHHVSLLCRTLESLDGSPNGSSQEGVEDSLGSQEQYAMAAVKAVYHIASQSSEAVATLLDYRPQENGGAGDKSNPLGPNRLHATSGPSENQPKETRGSSGRAEKTKESEEGQSQHPLLRGLLRLADPTFTCKAARAKELVTTSLSTLNMVAERAERRHLSRLECVLSSPAMTHCVSSESSYEHMLLSLMLLATLVDSDELATKLCSHSGLVDGCLFLKIFRYISSRPAQAVTEGCWAELELEMLRFLTSLFTQTSSMWVSFLNSSCQCHSEVVQMVVVLLHRQWLDIRGRESVRECSRSSGEPSWWLAPGVQLLREALVFLHWLLFQHPSFSEHRRPVLHMYDQVIPAVRETLRSIPDLTLSEELVLEDICRPESEDTEDMDTDT